MRCIRFIIIILVMIPFIVRSQDFTQYHEDLSGLAWIEGNLFVGIHDVKASPQTEQMHRFSLIILPGDNQEYLACLPVFPEFPAGTGLPSDLESACRLPGRQGFLFCESGQSWGGEKRIFYAKYQDDELKIIDYIDWPVEITNVEATEVCKVGDKLVFVYAERAEGSPSTYIRWAEFSPEPLSIGTFREIKYKSKSPFKSSFRPVSGMDIDTNGNIYISDAYDPGVDTGPYKSHIRMIGKIFPDKSGEPVIKLKKQALLGTMDGLKVESVAIKSSQNGEKSIYYGTDDEHHKGILRVLP